MIHGIGGGCDILDPDVFEQHLHLKKRESVIWVDTFGNVNRWVRQTSP